MPSLDTERVDLLNRQAQQEYYRDIAQALAINLEAESLARKLGYTAGLALSLLQQAYCNQRRASNETALKQLLEALPLFGENSDARGELNTLKLIGDIYHQTGGFTDALVYYFKTLQRADGLNEPGLAGSIYVSIGIVYGDLENYGESRDYLLKALRIFREANHPQGLAVCLNNLGSLCGQIKAFSEALTYLHEAVELAERIGFTQIHTYSLIHMGEAYRNLGDTDNAHLYFNKGLLLARTAEDKEAEIECYRNFAELAVASGQTAHALESCRYALSLAEEMNAGLRTAELYRLYAEIWEAHGDMLQALQWYKKFHVLDREYVNADTQKASRNLRMQFEVEKSQKEAEIHRLRTVELASALRELEAANNELTYLNQEKSEFMSIAAHDLRNPLIAVHNDLRSLRMEFDMLGNDDILRISQRCERSTKRMLTLVANLLDYNAIELGGVKLLYEAVDWRSVVEQTVEMFQRRALEKNIAIATVFDDPVPCVWTDRRSLGQIVENLVSNALKFSPTGTGICIRLCRSTDVVRLEIQDEGPGLTEEDKKALFGKFRKLSAQPTAGEVSTGLGLSIVHALVTGMNGTVRCESDHGKGACFIVELPIADGAAVAE